MGFVFRKSVKLLPGVKLNFSKSGLSSISFGGRSGRVTVGSKRTTTSFSLPRTGLRYQTSSSNRSSHSRKLHSIFSDDIPNNRYYSKSSDNPWTDKTQWGCTSLVVGVSFFFLFCIGGNFDWAIGSLIIFGLLYVLLVHVFNKRHIHFHGFHNSTASPSDKECSEDDSHNESTEIAVHENRYTATLKAAVVSSFMVEHQSRLRVYEDSKKLMATTVNFDVFLRRADNAIDFIKWCFEQKKAGMPVNANMSETDAMDDFCKVFNQHCVRIGRTIADTAQTPIKARNAIPKLELIQSSLKPAYNRAECNAEMNTLVYKMKSAADTKK